MYTRLSLLMFLIYAPMGAFWPLFSLRLKKLGFTPLEIAFAAATQAIGSLFAPLLAGQIADRWLSAERCMTLFAVIVAVLLAMMADATSPLAVFVTGLAFWMFMVPIATLGNSSCFAHLPRPEKQFGSIRLWGTVGWVVLGWIGGYALQQPGWLTLILEQVRPERPQFDLADTFRLGSLTAILLAFQALTLTPTPPRPQARDPFAPLAALRLLRQRDFALFFACHLALSLTLPFSTQNTPLLLDELGIADHWKGPALTLGQTAEVVSMALLPWLLTRCGLRRVLLLGAGAWAMVLAVQALGHPTALVVSCLTLNGLYITCFIIAGQMFVNSRAGPEVRASAQALISFTSGTGMLAGYALSGVVAQQVGGAFRPTFTVAALIALVAVTGFAVWFHPEEQQ